MSSSADLRVELGSGYAPDPEYNIHLDLDPAAPVEIVADASKRLPFETGTVFKLKAVDVLEHISYRDTEATLAEWARIMKPGGLLYVQVPEASVAIRNYVENPQGQVVAEFASQPPLVSLAWRLLGGHYDGHYSRNCELWRYNAHYALFDQDSLTEALDKAGFDVVSLTINAHPNILCWARRRG